jgi:hypothetical protein
LRGVDQLGQLTPLVNTTRVTYAFRSKVFQPSSSGFKMGQDVARVGDVNGDGLDDLLIGGLGEAYLIFGSPTGWSASTPDVVFTGTAASRFGSLVAGLGDFNGDGTNDFAIAAGLAAVGANVTAGRVLVFFGRPLVSGASDWPATVSITGTCPADVCFEHDFATSAFGFGLSSAGDFNGDGVPDLAVGAPSYPGATGGNALSGRLYVLLGQPFQANMTKPMGQTFWQIDIAVPSAARGFYIEGDNVNINALGNSIAPLGNFDGTSGDDLIVAAPSSATIAVAQGKAFFLSGHPYDFLMDSGVKQLASSELGMRGMNGVPSGAPIDTGTKGYFAGAVYSTGNVRDLSSGTAGMRDIVIKDNSTNEFLLYLGDSDFNSADRIRVQGDQTGKNPGTGSSVCSGFSPALSQQVAGDVDGDGLADMCAGENISSTSGAAPGNAYLWYGSVVASKTSGGILSYTEAHSIAPAAVSGATNRIVDFTGDLDGDGEPDIAIGDPTATSNKGALTILY